MMSWDQIEHQRQLQQVREIEKRIDPPVHVMGMVIEKNGSGDPFSCHVKFLGLPSEEGPELNLDLTLAKKLHELLGKFIETGCRQEWI